MRRPSIASVDDCRGRGLAFAGCCVLLLLCSAPAAAAQPVVTFESLMEEMLDLSRLAAFPDPAYTCRQSSSYDRASTTPDDAETWFANRDAGNFLRVEKHGDREEHVMMDAAGPGAIVRIWSANPRGTIRIYIDGEKRPAIAMPMKRLLGGEPPVGEPLSGIRSRGANCYLPIPYARHCKVTADDPKGLYYQINYRTYRQSTAVESFTNSFFDKHIELIRRVNARLSEPQRPFCDAQADRQHWMKSRTLMPGQTLELIDDRAPTYGAVVELSFQVKAARLDDALRECLITCAFDGRETVRCPLGDFFGSAPGANAYASFPIVVEEKDGVAVMACWWVMPYARSAAVAVHNLARQHIDLHVGFTLAEHEWTDRSLYFHALWRREGPIHTRPMRDFNYAALTGRGVWVGDALHVANPVLNWWGEGDEKIYVDGETFPSHFGTGTEDYYGYAWCNNQLFSAPQHNQTRCDGPNNFGHTSVTRFRFLDAIPFTESLRFDMELWHWAETDVSYGVTSYFYADQCEHNFPAIIDPAVRAIPHLELKIFQREGALEAEKLDITGKSTGCDPVIQALGMGEDGSWSDMHHLWCRPSAPGESVTLRVPVEAPGDYEVIVYLTKSYDYGIVQLSIDGRRAGEPIDTFDARHAAHVGGPEACSLGVHHLDGPAFDLTAEVVGANKDSREPGHYFGIDCIVLAPGTS